MITKEEFVKAFQSTLSGDMSSKDFARLAMQYLKSPDYNRWKAARAAEDLKSWKEGREHLLALIEEEKKAGTAIDYEIVPLKDGHDSLCVLINERRTVCFPSYFPKEFVDLNWHSVMEAKKRPRCGRHDCAVSTSIDDVTLTFGGGDLDEYGYWQFPCAICAEAYQKDHPDQPVWPRKDAPKQG